MVKKEAAKSEEDFDDVENAMAAIFAGCESESGKESPKKVEVKEENAPPSPKKRGRKPKSEVSGGQDVSSPKYLKKADEKSKKYSKSRKRDKEEKMANGAKSKSDGKSKKRHREEEQETRQEKLLDKYKGPFVRVAGSLENPDFVNVINHSSDALDSQSKRKGLADFDLRLRVTGFGPSCSSTLSSKYDPRVLDETWVCVFCKRGSHAEGLGDLFGPYFVKAEVVGCTSADGSPLKLKKEIAASFIIGSHPKRKKRGKLSQPAIRVDSEVSKTVSKNSDEEEVWFHEDCVCWNPEIRLVGSHVFGVEDAIMRTQKSPCSVCHLPGSTLCCIKPGCHDTAHYYCANSKDWRVDEDLFQAHCKKHSSNANM